MTRKFVNNFFDQKLFLPWLKTIVELNFLVYNLDAKTNEYFNGIQHNQTESCFSLAADVEVNNYMQAYFPPDFTYQQFGPDFSAQFFNASDWAEIVAASGAKYFVFTTKHHDGFANWPSSRNFGWNARDTGPKRDIVGELEAAFKLDGRVRFGLYHSMFEWFNPMYDYDEANNFTSRDYVVAKMMPELMELVMKYKPDILWSDGEAGATVDYWGSLEFLAWLYSDSPVRESVVTNDRWGRGTQCKHGDFFTCADRYNPGVLQPHKWENAMTLDR